MEPAGNFASCIKSRNHISIRIQHLRLLIDLDAAHAIMCASPELIAIEGAFNLILRDDVDHQAEAAYACMSDGTILITANLFLQSISGLLSIQLSEGWNRTYGIIYKTPVSDAVQKYIDLAQELYRR